VPLGRFYDDTRGAWTPRAWPSALVLFWFVAIPVIEWIAAGTPDRPWWWVAVGAIYGALLGWAVVRVQWRIWRRKHPPKERVS
jgi:hypothetical protein